jgi:hypothetical protein
MTEAIAEPNQGIVKHFTSWTVHILTLHPWTWTIPATIQLLGHTLPEYQLIDHQPGIENPVKEQQIRQGPDRIILPAATRADKVGVSNTAEESEHAFAPNPC